MYRRTILDSKSISLPADVLGENYNLVEQSPFRSAIVAHVAEDKSVVAGSLVLHLTFQHLNHVLHRSPHHLEGDLVYLFTVKMAIVMRVRVAHWNYYCYIR